jgi:hypothetical protein
MIFMTLNVPKKGLQNLFNVERPWTSMEKVIKLYYQRFFIYLSTLTYKNHDMFFFEQIHSKHFIPYSFPKEEFQWII